MPWKMLDRKSATSVVSVFYFFFVVEQFYLLMLFLFLQLQLCARFGWFSIFKSRVIAIAFWSLFGPKWQRTWKKEMLEFDVIRQTRASCAINKITALWKLGMAFSSIGIIVDHEMGIKKSLAIEPVVIKHWSKTRFLSTDVYSYCVHLQK